MSNIAKIIVRCVWIHQLKNIDVELPQHWIIHWYCRRSRSGRFAAVLGTLSTYPCGGESDGRIVAFGILDEVKRTPENVTAKFISQC